jgi:pimeloyl-ACP methyl ester carboxylesterase
MDKFIEVNGVTIHYTTTEGVGDTVVLMHGWGCNHTTLASIERVVSECGNHIINVDFPGFGSSTEPQEVWGVEAYTAAVRVLLQAEHVERPILLGHSFGGRVGILYASQYPVEKLVLVDAAGVKPRRPISYYWRVYSFKTVKVVLPLLIGRKAANRYIDKVRNSRGSADYAAASPMMRSILSRVVNEDLRHVMPAITAPTLLIWGEDDTATPLNDAKIMERLIPEAGLVSFPGCGHYSFLDNPIQFAAVLRSFLKS